MMVAGQEFSNGLNKIRDEIMYSELNKRLLELLCQDVIDLNAIEDLLKQGADPLGSGNKDDNDEHIFGQFLWELGCDEYPSLCEKIIDITELFIDYGMDIASYGFPEYDGNNINPLWNLAYFKKPEAIRVLKILVDNGLDIHSIEEFVDHTFIDFLVDLVDESMNDELTVQVKMLMLLASYNHIREGSEYFKRCLNFDKNEYDLDKFKNHDDFRYTFRWVFDKSVPKYEFWCDISDHRGNKVWTFMLYESSLGLI